MNVEAPDFLAAADKLRTVHQLLTGAASPLNENEQRVLGQYHEAGREYITSCLQIITDPAFADVFMRIQNNVDGEALLVDHVGEDRRTRIKLVRSAREAGAIDIEYVVLAFSGTLLRDDTKLFQEFQRVVRQEHASPVPSDDPWIFDMQIVGARNSGIRFTGRRASVPEDLLHEDILPEFIQNIIAMSGKMESCIRQDALEHAGIHTFNEEALLAQVKGFQEASKILFGVLPKKKT